MQRPDFKTAVKAAPEWVRDALKTINELEYIIEKGVEYANQNNIPIPPKYVPKNNTPINNPSNN